MEHAKLEKYNRASGSLDDRKFIIMSVKWLKLLELNRLSESGMNEVEEVDFFVNFAFIMDKEDFPKALPSQSPPL